MCLKYFHLHPHPSISTYTENKNMIIYATTAASACVGHILAGSATACLSEGR